MIESAIYTGTLRHRRHSPKRHEFTFPLFMVLADIDRLHSLMSISQFSSYNRWNWACYHEGDHFGDPALPLRQRIAADAAMHGVDLPIGKIFLLTHLRYLGYNFSPVSFYYCCGESGACEAILAEVNNTFGETQNYWLTPQNRISYGKGQRYRFDKTFHVSPFMPMQQQYDWTFTAPEDKLVVESMNFQKGELVFDSTLSMERREWTASELRRVLMGYPLLTARVILSIHYHAIRLFFKRVPVVTHPGAGNFTPSVTKHLGASWKVD